MKTVTITQWYEFSVVAEVQVPDDYETVDIQEAFEDFPISIEVKMRDDEGWFGEDHAVISYATEDLTTTGGIEVIEPEQPEGEPA
jgi:hypothetical protein